jgi:hypothetical protein
MGVPLSTPTPWTTIVTGRDQDSPDDVSPTRNSLYKDQLDPLDAMNSAA